VAATLGPDDTEVFLDPQPRFLKRVSGIEPAPGGVHVLLETFGVRSTQRLALSGYGGDVVGALFPAELKPQAEYLYGQTLATPMIAKARELGWSVDPRPHLAFRNSGAAARLYMRPAIDAAEYARRWEEGDLDRVGQYDRREVQTALWPWLRERGYLDDADEAELADWVGTQLGNRPAYLRPGLRFMGRYPGGEDRLAEKIRDDVNAVLAAAHEPPLPIPGAEMEDEPPDEPGDAPWPSRGDTRPAVRRQPIPERVRHEVWRRDQGRCVDCGSRERLEFDHIVPISRGGSNTARNLELRCESCNRRKSARI
jgi:hypothetical protein